MTSFTPDAARALEGPDWLSARRAAAVERLGALTWPTSSDEIWRYSRIDDFDLDAYRPVEPSSLGVIGSDAAPGGGPVSAEVGAHAGLLVVRNGRVVHHELEPALESKGVRVCDLATCDEARVAEVYGTCTQCHF